MREKIEKYSKNKMLTLLLIVTSMFVYIILNIILLIRQVIFHSEFIFLFLISSIIFFLFYLLVLFAMAINDQIKGKILIAPSVDSFDEAIGIIKDYSSYNPLIYYDIVVIFEKIIMKLHSDMNRLDEKHRGLVTSLNYIIVNEQAGIQFSNFAYNYPERFSKFLDEILILDFSKIEDLILWDIIHLYEKSIEYPKDRRNTFIFGVTSIIINFGSKLKKITIGIEIFIAIVATILVFYNWETPIFNVISVISIWLVITNEFAEYIITKMGSNDFV